MPLSLFGLHSATRIADLWTGSQQLATGTYTATIPPGGVSLISAAPAP